MSKIKSFLATPLGRKIEHVVFAFLAAFGTTLVFNGEHLLSEHGLSALKSAAPALVVTALLTAWYAVRGQIPAPIVTVAQDAVAEIKKAVRKPKSTATPKNPPSKPAA